MFNLYIAESREKHLGARKMVTADEDKENADEEEYDVHVSFPRFKPHRDSLLASEPKLEAGM
ncbi:MAG: hypothetical protein ACXVI0_05955 [Halobacteriota archaeon]